MSFIDERPLIEGRHHIEAYLIKGERQTIEFKQRLTKPQKIAKTITSLANTDGGIIMIGIRDDKAIVGIDVEQEKYILHDAVNHFCDPPVKLSVTEVLVPKEENPHQLVSVLVVEIPKSDSKPHKAQYKPNEWQVYIRHKDQTLIAGAKTERLLETDGKLIKKPKLSKNQQRLLTYLAKNDRITQKEYAALVNISERRARKELLENLNIGIIRVLEHEQEDVYVL
ncbi:MAG: ATP-binding protein [Fulvivirga sp.]